MRKSFVILKFKKNNTDSSPPGRGVGVGHIVPIIFFEFPRFCKHTLICLTIISVLFAVSSCSFKGYKPITDFEDNNIVTPYIFAVDFEKALYKTSIEIYGNNITGLTLIKRTDSAIRVVSMSELGIKYFDFEFPIDRLKPIKVHYIMELLNKKPLINMIKSDFSLLLFPPTINESEIRVNDKDNSRMLAKYNKQVYFFNSSGTISEIAKRRTFKPIISISAYTHDLPDTIYIDHGKIEFEFGIIK